jgi:fructose-bisphosphate aldolase/2-amino-3,7-dideoxy-D-threo-hept-6-ulosonate synthase
MKRRIIMSADTGKMIKMSRIFDETGTCIIFAGCHQMTSYSIYPGQADVVEASRKAIEGGATCLNIGKGFNQKVVPVLKRGVSVLNYLPVYPAYSKTNPYEMIITSTVEEALINGVDGIVCPVDFYGDQAGEAMKMVAAYTRECAKYGMVFIVEAEFPTFYASNDDNIKKYGAEYLMFAGRICAELGVDVISTNYTNDPDSFKKIIDYVKLPVLINGGTKVSEEEFLRMVATTAQAGARGCLIGRNISEAKDPVKMTRAIGELFRNKNSTAEQAIEILR